MAARKARLGRDAQNEWAPFRLEAVRKAGRTLTSMRAAGLLAQGRGGDRRSINATLIEHLGAPSHQAAWERANRWQRLAAWPEPAYRAWLATMRALPDAEITEAAALRGAEGSNRAGLFLSEETEWLTPWTVLDRAVVALAAIDLDPCADAGRHVPAGTHFTVADDGLAQPWHGRVFLNPPYGREVGLWIAKLAAEIAKGDGRRILGGWLGLRLSLAKMSLDELHHVHRLGQHLLSVRGSACLKDGLPVRMGPLPAENGRRERGVGPDRHVS